MTDEAKRLCERAIECAALAIHEDDEGAIDLEMVAGILAATFCVDALAVVRALEDRVEEIADYGCRDEDEACGECKPCRQNDADRQQDRALDAADRGRL